MDVNDAMNDSEMEFLSLRERISLLKNRDQSKKIVRNSILSKRTHSISDSDDSDSNKKDFDDELPPLPITLPEKKVLEISLLSDDDDDVIEIESISKNSQTKDELATDIYQNEYDSTKADIHKTTDIILQPRKKSKNSPIKKVQDINKEIAKQEKLKLREDKKREKDLAKALKQSEKEMQRSKKPDECLKAMKVVIDHNLIGENESQDIFCALDEKSVKYCIEENPICLSVAWCKTVIDVTIENNELLKEEREEFENNLVVLIPNESFIKMIHAFLQKSKGNDTSETILSDYVVNISSMFPEMKITCVVLNLDSYLKSLKNNPNSELKKIAKQVSKIAIEEALVEVQLQAAVNFIFSNSMRDFGDLLFRFTKAIAEAPQKREKQMQKDSAFSWYADADTSCPVKLDKDRSSFLKLWQQQLQQFQNVGPEMAEAIAAVYSSPSDLVEAYKKCLNTKEAEGLLKDIVVRRNYGPLGTQRRIGPELSYKIYIFFNSQDGSQILQR